MEMEIRRTLERKEIDDMTSNSKEESLYNL